MNGSEPAFPNFGGKVVVSKDGGVTPLATGGMSTRLVVAAWAMHGILTTAKEITFADGQKPKDSRSIAEAALIYADALIAACKEKPNAQ